MLLVMSRDLSHHTLFRENVKWPVDMDPVFKDFLVDLLQKDPKKRLSWPHLLYHPFVCGGMWHVHVRLHVDETVLAGLDIEQLMQCAHEGQLLVSPRLCQHRARSCPVKTGHAAVVGAILSGSVALDVQQLGVHLQDCCTGSSQLASTLQAAHVLVEQQQQASAVAGSGLVFWLLSLCSDLAQGEREGAGVGGVSLPSVVKLLVQTTSLLLVSQARGKVAMVNSHL